MQIRFGRHIANFLCLSMLGTALIACTSPSDGYHQTNTIKPMSSHYEDGKFRNSKPTQEMRFIDSAKAMWRLITQKAPDSSPAAPLDIVPLTHEDLLKAPDHSLWRLGHSTVLIKLQGKFWLTDPVFSDRASPFAFGGFKRFHVPPIARENLPEIEAVILSHDHYDHLDKDTIVAIAPKVKHFLTPLGVGDRLIDWGIPILKIRQFDWWDEAQIGAIRFVATPALHFSGRTPWDRNSTLWASWVLIAPDARIFFGGDSGYFDGFKAIGERFGPFDLTLLENGAYNEGWADIHMQPEQTVQAHRDLRGKQLVPIHNGTFDLSLHPWTEPLERISKLAKQQDIALSTPRIGARLDMLQPEDGIAWWRPTEPLRQEVTAIEQQQLVPKRADL